MVLYFQGPYQMEVHTHPVERIEARGWGFSELKCHWSIPLHETNYVRAICTGQGEELFVYVNICGFAVIASWITVIFAVKFTRK